MKKFLQVKVFVFLWCVIATGIFTNATAQFALGADVGWLQQMEASGMKFYDQNGKQGDCLEIMKNLGINAIRLRTWINPSMNTGKGSHCSQKETIQMAMRCKKLGLRVMINFHYANSWVSVGSRSTPKEWANMDYPTMQKALYDYAYGFCKEMKDSGVTPAWFQNGNETNGGLCPPIGELSKSPVQMTGLLNKGYEAIHAVFPYPETKVLIHVAQPQNTAGAAMVRTFRANGGKLDAMGWSSYAGSGNVDGLFTNVKTWYNEFKLETYMVEIGSEESPDKQKTLIDKWTTGIESINKPCEGGTFYWEAEGYKDPFIWKCHIFDGSGKATAAFDAYKNPSLTKTCMITGIRPHRATADEDNSQNPKPRFCYLNPSTNKIFITENEAFTFSIHDMTGRKIAEGKGVNVASVKVGTGFGVYIVNIQDRYGHKIVKVSRCRL